jgi:hypothetical protein
LLRGAGSSGNPDPSFPNLNTSMGEIVLYNFLINVIKNLKTILTLDVFKFRESLPQHA